MFGTPAPSQVTQFFEGPSTPTPQLCINFHAWPNSKLEVAQHFSYKVKILFCEVSLARIWKKYNIPCSKFKDDL